MKYFSFLFAFLFISFSLSAQDFMDELDREMCDCLNEKIEKDNIETDEGKFMALGMCMISESGKYDKQIEKKYGFYYLNDMEKWGEIIGQRLVFKCETFYNIVFEQLQDTSSILHQQLEHQTFEDVSDDTVEQNNFKDDGLQLTVRGKVVSFESKGYPTISIEQKGKKATFYFVTYFDGVELLERPDKLINKKLSISYDYLELYLPEENTFKEVKIVTGIEE